MRRRPSSRGRWWRSAMSWRFSWPVRRLSTAENWPVTPISDAHALRIGPQVVPPDLDLAGVGSEHRGEHVDGRRLAGAVRAEQGEDRSRGDLEVDPVEHDVVAVGLPKAGGPNRGGGHDRASATNAGRWSDVEILNAGLPDRCGDRVEELSAERDPGAPRACRRCRASLPRASLRPTPCRSRSMLASR